MQESGVKKYFFLQALVLIIKKQEDIFIKGLREDDGYPADPEDGYGWKNYSVNVCVDILWKIMGYRSE